MKNNPLKLCILSTKNANNAFDTNQNNLNKFLTESYDKEVNYDMFKNELKNKIFSKNSSSPNFNEQLESKFSNINKKNNFSNKYALFNKNHINLNKENKPDTNKGYLNINFNTNSSKNSKFDEYFKELIYKPKKFFDIDEMEKNNLYFILKVKENSTMEDLKKSYRNLSKIHHPDKGGCPEEFQNINRAYKILTNEQCRALYDQHSTEAFALIEILLKDQ